MNGLTLAIVNEGADYQNRLATARMKSARARFCVWCDRVWSEVAHQRRFEDCRAYTVEDMARSVIELENYYQQHIKEL